MRTQHFNNRFTSKTTLLLIVAAQLAAFMCPIVQAAKPNILVCMADDASFPYCGAYGCKWAETPTFDRIAREGLLFTNAYTPNAKCAPSRSCFLTGRNSWQLKAAANHWCFFPPEFKTYPEALAQAGYFVGKTGKDWAPGVAVDEAGKRRLLCGQGFDKAKLKAPAQHISDNDYASNFDAFLDAAPDDKSWCFWYGSVEPHRAYEHGVSQKDGWRKPSDVDKVPGYWPDMESVRIDMLDFAYELKYFDEQLGKMLASLEKRGQLKNTIVIVTADNGMAFPRCKGQAYHASNHLPLAIMWPEGIKQPGRSVDSFVSFIDIAPTLLELAELDWEKSGMQAFAGRSLVKLFNDPKAVAREHVLIGKERHDIGRPHDWGYPIRGIVKGNWLYVKNYETTRWPAGDPVTGYLNCDGGATKTEILNLRRNQSSTKFWDLAFGMRPSEELFDLSKDPDCLKNLADAPEAQSQKQSLSQLMQAELTAENDPRMMGRGHEFDEYPYADEKHRGFYERFRAGENIRAGWVNPTDYEE